MPPWKPDKSYSRLMDENELSDAEIQLIEDWVYGGMPEGDPSLTPPLPQFSDGSQIGEPDLVLSFSQAYTHQGNNEDQYQIMVLPTGLTEDRVLKAMEMRPGNTRIVHHALFALDTTGQGQAMDAASAEYGYEAFGGFGVTTVDNYPGYVPGLTPRVYPEGIGQIMYKNSDLLVQVHYAPISADETDSSTVNLFFADSTEVINRYVKRQLMLPFGGTLTNGPFIIPADQVKTFHGVWNVSNKISLLGLAPHMHYLGKDWTVFAVTPSNDTINLIRINDWDFNWQGSYMFPRFIVLEPGTQVHASATYDNTVDNPYNPHNPPQMVTWGEGTEDEMYYLPFVYVPYESGDENIVFEEDSSLTSVLDGMGIGMPNSKIYAPYPNPAGRDVKIGFSLGEAKKVTIELLDLNGKTVRMIKDDTFYSMGQHTIEFNTDELAKGIYTIAVKSNDGVMTEKLIVQ